MHKLILISAFALVSTASWSDFSCPEGTNAACLDNGDKVCPVSAKCVSADVVCLDRQSCAPGVGFICESEYDEILNDYKKVIDQHQQLQSENVGLRERRLEQKNCVKNASTLAGARKCVS